MDEMSVQARLIGWPHPTRINRETLSKIDRTDCLSRLTQSAFVLISGRLGAVYGHQKILLIGGGFLVVFSLINAFCSTYESFVSARALTGIGGGLLMPNAVAMLMIMVPPGRARNVTMAFFAASPPIGGWCGAILAGIFVELTDWKWLFIFM